MFNSELDHEYGEHLTKGNADFMRHLAEGREDGDILTTVPDAQLVNEVILMSIGATSAPVVSSQHIDPGMLDRQVTNVTVRLRQPAAT